MGLRTLMGLRPLYVDLCHVGLFQVWADQQEVPGLEANQKADRGPQNILARALEHAAKNDTLNISKTKR
jgi:hypothetical protein